MTQSGHHQIGPISLQAPTANAIGVGQDRISFVSANPNPYCCTEHRFCYWIKIVNLHPKFK